MENVKNKTGSPVGTQNFNKNSKNKVGGLRFSDPSDTYANERQLYLSFYHLASKREVNFKAFVESYSENFNSNWNYEPVFGRADDLATFMNTKRTLSVVWKVPAATLEEAQSNLQRTNLLAKFMYPAYEISNQANTIAKPPLMRIAFANLIRNAAAGPSPSAMEAGLLGTVGSLSITPSFGEEGFFDPESATIYPKLITINIDFTVLHEHDVGWMAGSAEGDDVTTPFGFDSPELENYPYIELSPRPEPKKPISQDATLEENPDVPEGSQVNEDINDQGRAQREANAQRQLDQADQDYHESQAYGL